MVVFTPCSLLSVTKVSQTTKIFSEVGKTSHQSKTPCMECNHPQGMALCNSNDIAVTDQTTMGKTYVLGVDWRMKAILEMNTVKLF